MTGRRAEGESEGWRAAGAGRTWRRCAAVLAVIALGCGPALPGSADEAPLTVLMISLDGTRPEDVREETMPTLTRLGREGLRAGRMRAARPTNTFPNHVTLATGVAPERHGVVNNVFIDPERGRFRKRDIPDWIDVEPIWSRLERAGIPTASYHWVGSEGAWRGVAPRHWKKFDKATQADTKVDQILAWLDLADPAERPRLVMSWFHGADHAGHHDGPDTEAVVTTLRAQDRAIAKLVEGLEARGLRDSTLLLFVSDHGMSAPTRFVDLGSRLKDAGVRASVLGIGGFATITLRDPESPEAAARDLARAAEVAREHGLTLYPRSEAPAALRVANPRFGDAVATAPLGTAIVYPGLSIVGFHGYAPDEPSMSALFIASGAGVPAGRRIPELDAVDVTPTLLALFEVSPGDEDELEGRPLTELVDAVRARGATSARIPDRPAATPAPSEEASP